MSRPKDILLEGVQLLERVLAPKGFAFRFGGEGRGSGGEFAFGDFVCGEKRLELHFRHSLGLVRYCIGNQSASHEAYMRELGIWGQCHCQGFSDDPLNGFRGLAHDLSFAEDFLSGPAAILQRTANKEAVVEDSRSKDLMAGYVGDREKLEKLRTCFREGRYSEVITLAEELKYPESMTQSERRLLEIALKRSNS